jgi:hypothetical protein
MVISKFNQDAKFVKEKIVVMGAVGVEDVMDLIIQYTSVILTITCNDTII